MVGPEHLTLGLVCIKSPAEWVHEQEGLAFLFVEGTGKYVCGRMSQQVSPGDVLISSGGRGGRLSAPKGGELVFRAFFLRLEHLFPLFATEEISLVDDLTEGLKVFRFHPASSPVAKECRRLVKSVPGEANLDHRSQLLRIAALILMEEFKGVRSRRVGFVRSEEHMAQVLERVSTQELLSCSVEELAARFGCSRRHLSRLFHQHFGFSMAALRMDMRMVKAVSLLRNPDAKVINVAEQCGFNHLGLFNTCFKKRFGTSPGEWRKKASQSPSGIPGTAQTGCPMVSKGLCPWGDKVQAVPDESFKRLHLIVPAPTPPFVGMPVLARMPQKPAALALRKLQSLVL